MNKRLITFSLIMTCFHFVIAQSSQRGNITGKIIDAGSRLPIPSATVSILHEKDSTLVIGLSSGKDGSFSASVGSGTYITRISFMGYQDVFENISVTKAAPSVNLDTIFLHESPILLDETIVTARIPEIVIKGDTLEYNTGAYRVTEMAVIEDLLKQMTGVEIDADGNIKVNGKVIRKILVDGKEFFSDNPQVASKNLPAKMVDKIQVFDKKSETEELTGFDDGKEEMVMNLTVKPEIKGGAFGNVAAGYGNKERYETNAMVNYMRNQDRMTFLGGLNNTNSVANPSDIAIRTNMGIGVGAAMGGMGNAGGGVTSSESAGFSFTKEPSKKFSISGSLLYGGSHTESTSRTYTQNFLKQGDTFEADSTQSDTYNDNVNVNLHAVWKPDSATMIMFRPNISFQGSDRETINHFATTRQDGSTINHGNSAYTSHGKGNNFGGEIYISRRLKKKGRSISIVLNSLVNDTDNKDINRSNTYYQEMGNDDFIDQRITHKNNSLNWGSRISYVEPIGKQKFLQFTYNFSQNSSESDKDTRTRDEEGAYTVLDKQYSKFHKNNASNQSVGIAFRADKGKFDYTIGFNVHPSNAKRKTFVGDSLINDISQNVTNYSPNALFNYKWSPQKNMQFMYNGRSQQPSVEQLSPVRDITNPLNITYGNPDLKPSFHHNINLRFQNMQFETGRTYMLNSTYNYTTNSIVSARFTDPETGKKENTYKNVNGNWNGNINFIASQPVINKKFSLSSSTSGNYARNNGFSNFEENISRQMSFSETLSINYKGDKFNLFLRGNISYNKVRNSLEGQQDREFMNYGTSSYSIIRLPFDLSIQNDIQYATNSGYYAGFKQNEVLWNASLEKTLLKQKNGMIRLKIYDILQQRSNIHRSVSSNFIRDTTTNSLTSYFMVHFTYRFNVFKGGASPENAPLGGVYRMM